MKLTLILFVLIIIAFCVGYLAFKIVDVVDLLTDIADSLGEARKTLGETQAKVRRIRNLENKTRDNTRDTLRELEAIHQRIQFIVRHKVTAEPPNSNHHESH